MWPVVWLRHTIRNGPPSYRASSLQIVVVSAVCLGALALSLSFYLALSRGRRPRGISCAATRLRTTCNMGTPTIAVPTYRHTVCYCRYCYHGIPSGRERDTSRSKNAREVHTHACRGDTAVAGTRYRVLGAVTDMEKHIACDKTATASLRGKRQNTSCGNVLPPHPPTGTNCTPLGQRHTASRPTLPPDNSSLVVRLAPSTAICASAIAF